MLKLLVLFPKALLARKVSPARRHSIQAIQQAATVKVSGPGFVEYDDRKSVNDNLDRIMPDADAVLWYKPEGHAGRYAALIGTKECRVPSIMRFNEAWWPDRRAAKEVEACGAKIVIIHHEIDRKQFKGVNATVEHIPHCASGAVFTCRVHHDHRKIDCLLTGVLSKEIYPVRERFANLIRSNAISGEIRPHPGYRLADSQACEQEVASYADHLSRAKIALVCSSVYKYPLAKYVEAAMAGCFVIGDMPEEAPPLYEKIVMPINISWSDSEIAEFIKGWLQSDVARQRRSVESQRIAAEHFCQERYAEKFVEAVERYINAST